MKRKADEFEKQAERLIPFFIRNSSSSIEAAIAPSVARALRRTAKRHHKKGWALGYAAAVYSTLKHPIRYKWNPPPRRKRV